MFKKLIYLIRKKWFCYNYRKKVGMANACTINSGYFNILTPEEMYGHTPEEIDRMENERLDQYWQELREYAATKNIILKEKITDD